MLCVQQPVRLSLSLLPQQVVKIFNLFITYGDTFLPNPSTYDELYYELIRMQKVFEDVHTMGRTNHSGLSPCSGFHSTRAVRSFIFLLQGLCPLSLSLSSAAKRYSSPDARSQFHSSASQLAGNLVNVRSIAAHFHPRINAWSSSHQVTSITPEQVWGYGSG